MDTNLIEKKLLQNVTEEISAEVETFISHLKTKYGKYYATYTSVDIIQNISCGTDRNHKPYANFSLSTSEDSLSYLLKKILLKAYSEQMLKHKINTLINNLKVLE